MKLHPVEVQPVQSKSIALTCKEAAISEQSYFRWRKEYGGLPGSPLENGYGESFNGKLSDECMKLEIFYSQKEAQVIISAWGSLQPRVPPVTPRLPPAGTGDNGGDCNNSYTHQQSCSRLSMGLVPEPSQVIHMKHEAPRLT